VNAVLLQQFLLVAASTALLVVVLRHARDGHLEFGLTMAWCGVAAVGFCTAISIPYLEDLGRVLRVVPAALFAGIVGVILATVALALSEMVSHQRQGIQTLTEVLGLRNISPPLPTARTQHAVLAIVPAFNEEATISDCVNGLLGLGVPVLVVDDGSTDSTGEHASTAGANVLRLEVNQGVGGALRAAYRAARAHGYHAVVQSDGDGQHPATSVQTLLTAFRSEPVDLLIGSRFVDPSERGDVSLARRIAIALLARAASRAGGGRLTDTTSGLRVVREPLLGALADWIPRHYLGDTYEVALGAARGSYSIREIGVEVRPRPFGQSTASTWTALRLTIRCLVITLLPTQRRLSPRRP
jgi:hypothetical protein